jgi:hypothetical protein
MRCDESEDFWWRSKAEGEAKAWSLPRQILLDGLRHVVD